MGKEAKRDDFIPVAVVNLFVEMLVFSAQPDFLLKVSKVVVDWLRKKGAIIGR